MWRRERPLCPKEGGLKVMNDDCQRLFLKEKVTSTRCGHHQASFELSAELVGDADNARVMVLGVDRVALD
jgi:hypothetical protein